jgi:hypothetical protein
MIELYKIKNPYNDDQYGAGVKNSRCVYSKKGKTWNSLSSLKSHLAAVQRWDKRAFETFYNNWLVIKITENGIETIGTVKDFR